MEELRRSTRGQRRHQEYCLEMKSKFPIYWNKCNEACCAWCGLNFYRRYFAQLNPETLYHSHW
uniref:Uncharacterized protein n=1 Tax=viral metagenome TaxID=1070528 RepID=A0A6C0IWT2_9ZZZZ